MLRSVVTIVRILSTKRLPAKDWVPELVFRYITPWRAHSSAKLLWSALRPRCREGPERLLRLEHLRGNAGQPEASLATAAWLRSA